MSAGQTFWMTRGRFERGQDAGGRRCAYRQAAVIALTVFSISVTDSLTFEKVKLPRHDSQGPAAVIITGPDEAARQTTSTLKAPERFLHVSETHTSVPSQTFHWTPPKRSLICIQLSYVPDSQMG